MQAFEYKSPATLREAIALLAPRWGEADILAGGSDLISLMKDYIHTPKRVVNIKRIPELNGISKTAAGLRIGALATLDRWPRTPTVRTEYPSLVTAALGVSSQQIRNMGTVGGDLCQRPHCWYFRQGFGLLAKDRDGHMLVPEGENRYHAIFGNSGPAYFVSASSLGPALIALGAKFRVAGPPDRATWRPMRSSGRLAGRTNARPRSSPTRSSPKLWCLPRAGCATPLTRCGKGSRSIFRSPRHRWRCA